jgi:hypothetical protein
MTTGPIADLFGALPAFPGGLLVPASEVFARLQIADAKQAEKDEALRMARAYTATFEEAIGRPILRRQGVDLDFAADDEGGLEYSARFRAWRIDMDFAFPVEFVESVRIDSDATGVFDIDFDTADVIDAADYRALWLDGLVLFINERVSLPPTEAGKAVRVRVTCGYEPRSDAPGWEPTVGARPMPPAIEEAYLEQLSLSWRRRNAPHLRYEGKPTGAGSASAGFAVSTLAPKVVEMLRPYATWQAALALQSAGGGAGATGGEG